MKSETPLQAFPQLYNIAHECGTDKGHVGPSQDWSANNYTDIYQAYLGQDRLTMENICEIGLGVPGPNWESDIAQGSNEGGGGSMRMWQEFLPNTKIYGLDINAAPHLDNDQVTTFVVDQSDVASLEAFKAKTPDVLFDVIIDDGSHIADHQQLTLSLLWDKLKPGGYYFIEDLNDLRPGATRHMKHAPVSSESTREIFKQYLDTGVLNPQNSFENQAFFDQISYLALHSFPCMQRPKDLFKEIIRNLVGRGGKGVLRQEFRTSAPKMIVMRKADS